MRDLPIDYSQWLSTGDVSIIIAFLIHFITKIFARIFTYASLTSFKIVTNIVYIFVELLLHQCLIVIRNVH